jgi:MurNAc alpha-1-phosphate uridylyltransferase
MIHQELKDKKVKFSDEKTALETGGGVQKALPLLKKTGADGFFVINSDALWLDKKETLLKQMERAWNPLEMDVLLAFVPTKKAKGDVPKGDYFIKNGKPVRRHPPQKKAPYCFMGVQILHPDIFKGHPLKKYSLVELYDKAEQNGRLGCLIFDGLWFHVGTPKAVQDTTKYFKRKKV